MTFTITPIRTGDQKDLFAHGEWHFPFNVFEQYSAAAIIFLPFHSKPHNICILFYYRSVEFQNLQDFLVLKRTALLFNYYLGGIIIIIIIIGRKRGSNVKL